MISCRVRTYCSWKPFSIAPIPFLLPEGDDLLPLGHWLPCNARVIAADVAALRACQQCQEVLGRYSREISEARIVHGLSHAQGIIRNLLCHGKRSGERVCASWSFRILGTILWWTQAVVVVSARRRSRCPRLRARPRRLRKRTMFHRARGAMRTDAWARLPFATALRPCRCPTA